MQQRDTIFNPSQTSALEVNKVLKNTYILLSATLIFSAIMAGLSMLLNVGFGVSMMCSIAALVIIWFVIPRTANSSKGLIAVFAFTGLLGFGLGPILNSYLGLANGPQIIMQALGGTAIIFFTLSGYALTTKKDFSYLAGFAMTGLIIVLVAALANMFLNIPALSLALSGAIVLIMSAFILFDTSRIINGGERNYIVATVGLYLSLYNIFTSLLHLLGAMSDD